MIRLTFVITLLLALSSTQAQHISLEETKSDLDFLKKAIETYNPGLHTYNPDFDSSVVRLARSIEDDSISHLEYFGLVSQLCAFSNEGHFDLGSWGDTIHKGFGNNDYSYLPISVKVIAGRIFVWNDYSNEQQLSRGDEVLMINGKWTAAVLQKLYKATPTDGAISTYADKVMESSFSWKYHLYVEQPVRFLITFKTPDGIHLGATIEALDKEEQNANFKKYAEPTPSEKPKGTTAFYELSHKKYYSILELPTFSYEVVRKEKVKSKKLYKGVFKELANKKASSLIIDLRDNRGGMNEFADDIIPYLLDAPSEDTYLKKSVSWEGKEKTYKMPKPSKYAFKGDIYVLVNGGTYSAASTLARYLKEYGNATIIGEETGTRYEGFSAGSKQYVSLPNSAVKIGIPRYHTTFPVSQKQTTTNRGLIPDQKVEYSIKDLINGRDLHMKQTLFLITKKRKS